MPRTQINCPKCRQPMVADVQQLFDAGADPQAKQMLLTGAFNIAQCPHCGYQGNLSAPIVYHDPAKELLLTFFPPEMMLPREEQERIIGPLLTRVMNSLPQEQRKGYLLNPQSMFTMQGLIERILEAGLLPTTKAASLPDIYPSTVDPGTDDTESGSNSTISPLLFIT